MQDLSYRKLLNLNALHTNQRYYLIILYILLKGKNNRLLFKDSLMLNKKILIFRCKNVLYHNKQILFLNHTNSEIIKLIYFSCTIVIVFFYIFRIIIFRIIIFRITIFRIYMIYKYVVHNRQNIIKMLNTIVLFAAVLELAMGRLKCGGTSVTIQYGPPHGRSLLTRSSTLAPPRFLFYYYGFSSGNSTADNYIKNVVVPAATTHFTNALQVYSIASNLALSSTACGTVPVPTSHNNPGVSSTDLIFYMTLDNTTGQGFVGTGGACEFDTLQGNPVAGIITINVENFYPLSFDAMLCS